MRTLRCLEHEHRLCCSGLDRGSLIDVSVDLRNGKWDEYFRIARRFGRYYSYKLSVDGAGMNGTVITALVEK